MISQVKKFSPKKRWDASSTEAIPPKDLGFSLTSHLYHFPPEIKADTVLNRIQGNPFRSCSPPRTSSPMMYNSAYAVSATLSLVCWFEAWFSPENQAFCFYMVDKYTYDMYYEFLRAIKGVRGTRDVHNFWRTPWSYLSTD